MSNGKIEKLAVLIDADNAQPSIVDGLLAISLYSLKCCAPKMNQMRK
jgi:hypothetical protein